MPGSSPVLGSIKASCAAVEVTVAGGRDVIVATADMGIPVATKGVTGVRIPDTGSKCRAVCSASFLACSKICLIFCSVSADSSSDSLDLPPVERRARGDFGDFAAVGLAMGAVVMVGDDLSSVDNLREVMGDGTVGACVCAGGAGSGFC